MNKSEQPRPARSLRVRVLAIALIPTLLLLCSGLAISSYLIVNALTEHARAERLSAVVDRVETTVVALREERRLTVGRLGPSARPELPQAREAVDRAVAAILPVIDKAGEESTTVATGLRALREDLAGLPDLRERVDGGQLGRLETATAFARIQNDMMGLIDGIARSATDQRAGEQLSSGEFVLLAADLLARETEMTAVAVAGIELSPAERAYTIQEGGAYDAEIDELNSAAPRLTSQEREQLEAIRASPAAALVDGVRVPVDEGGAVDLSIGPDRYEAAAAEVTSELHALGLSEIRAAVTSENAATTAVLTRALVASAALLIVAGGVLVLALTFANRLVRRLTRLRDDTLERAERELPDLVEALQAGRRPVDAPREAGRHGSDEIGQVASAFDRAHQLAVDTAAGQAALKAGFNAVFLNIAHRSQSIVHRQLKVLDEAERAEADPNQLARLFQLDHLAARERRNAENLIILGGGRPGRQWRDPVPLIEVVRGAVSETVQYNRIEHGRLPAVRIIGAAVADVVHLLAELLDNATSCSPPEALVHVRGNLVGRGLVIEVEDQGLGMEPLRRDEWNTVLATPPTFGMATLSDSSQLGLFVVAQLAHRHGIRVTLQESAYGGVQAVVLVPAGLVAETPDVGSPPALPAPAQHDQLVAAATDGGPVANGASPGSRAGRTEGRDTSAGERSLPTMHPGATPAGSGRPELPRRRRQDHLARQLTEVPPDEPAVVQGDDDHSSSAAPREPATTRTESPERALALSALQRGTRDGRAGAWWKGSQPTGEQRAANMSHSENTS